jgi:amino acid adenylation domain-containing protein
MIVALLGVLKVGAAYVPLDHQLPAAVLSEQLEILDTRIVVVQTHLAGRLPSGAVTLLETDSSRPLGENPATSHRSSVVGPLNLAYCTFTSGSTGKPKAVAIPHCGVARLVTDPNYVDLGSEQVLLQAAPLAFDVSTFEIWGALLNGCKLVLLPPGPVTFDAVADAIDQHQITTLWLTAAFFHQYCEYHLGSLRKIKQLLAGGDALRADIVQRVVAKYPGCRMINGYGPTEATTFASAYTIPHGFSSSSVPIGYPINRTQLYVLNEDFGVVDPGEEGELFIAGEGLARGYLGNPAETAEKFLPNPFSGLGARMYRSGDMCRRLGDGSLEFLGRRDRQVKLRGFRIELDRIEEALFQCEGVKDAAVVAAGATPERRQIIAYVSTKDRATSTPANWAEELAALLPNYMVPERWVVVDSLPIKPNGKVDRKRLPEPSVSVSDLGFLRPSSALEEAIASVWCEVLALPAIGTDRGFKSLGGSSIRAFESVYRLRQRLGTDIRIPPPIGNATVKEYAKRLERILDVSWMTVEEAGPAPTSGFASVNQQQLCFLLDFDGAAAAYRFHAEVTFHGQLNVEAIHSALSALIERHESLRTSYFRNDGRLCYQVSDENKIDYQVLDLSQDPEKYDNILSNELSRHIPDDTAPLVRWKLVKVSEMMWRLIVSEHHYVHDGQSFRTIINELADLYNSKCEHRDFDLPKIPYQYRHYCHSEWARRESAEFKRELRVWCERIEKYALAHKAMPANLARESGPFVGRQVRRLIGVELVQKIDESARRLGVTRFAMMLSAFAAAVSPQTGSESFLIGSGLANRSSSDYSAAVGMFVNTVPLAVTVGKNSSIADVAKKLSEEIDFALEHGSIPISDIVRELRLNGKGSGNAPFDVCFSFNDSVSKSARFRDLEVDVKELLENGSAKFPLNVVAMVNTDGENNVSIDFVFEYGISFFNEAQVEAIARSFEINLEAADFNATIVEGAALEIVLLTENHDLLVDSLLVRGENLDREQLIAWSDEEELEAIIRLSEELLPDVEVGPLDDLFSRGLHSLMVMQLTARCRDVLSFHLKASEVYRLRSPKNIAQYIAQSRIGSKER